MKNIMDFDIAFLTDPGRKRGGDTNQDSLVVLPADPARGLPPLLVVADGMGGHIGGAVASQKAVESITARYRQAGPRDEAPVLLAQCLQTAVEALVLHAEKNPDLLTMGTTVVAAILDGDTVHIANIGDSRAYLIHQGEMTQLSYDHSVVGDQVRMNLITPLEARSHPKRNRLTQSLSPKRPAIKPHISQATFEKGDTLVLCSDGLWGVIPEAILQVVANDLPTQEAVEKLVRLSLNSGGPDNISVIVARHAGATPLPTFIDENETSI